MNTYPTSDSSLERSARAQLRSVIEIAPKSPFLCVNRSLIRYGFAPAQKVSGILSTKPKFTRYRPFAASHSRGTKPPWWRTKVALGQDKQKAYIILNDSFLCLSCPSANFALQHGGFVPREWLAAKGLLSRPG